MLSSPLESVALPEGALDRLFALLLLTMAGVYLAGNLLLGDATVLASSSRIVLPCLASALIFYAVSRASRSLAWGLVVTYGLLWLVVYSRMVWAVPAFYGLALAALVYAARFLRVVGPDRGPFASLALLSTVVVLGCERSYTSFDMMNRLHAGDVHQDTLFHAAIAAMIKNYGVVSTGLHGLVETPYHTLSHVLMASLSLLSGAAAVEVYGVASWVLFAPILILCMTGLCLALVRGDASLLRTGWCLTSALLAVVPFLFKRWGSWDSFFVSESYLVSLGLFVAGSVLLYRRRLCTPDLLLLGLLVMLMSNAKASVGIVFAGLCVARLILVRGTDWRQDLAACTLSALAVGWVVVESARANAGTMNVAPLHFVQHYSFLGRSIEAVIDALRQNADLSVRTALAAVLAVAGFFLFHFIASWVAIGLAWRRAGFSTAIRTPLAAYSVAAFAAGALVIVLVAIPGGSAAYFSNVAFFVSLPALVLVGAEWLERWRIDSRVMFALALVIVALLGARNMGKAGLLHRQNASAGANALITELAQTRLASPMDRVLRPDAAQLAANPVARCSAKPFVYPAVSERPWTEVIAGTTEKCHYADYGYGQYRIADDPIRVTASLRLPPVMQKSTPAR